MTTAIDGIVSGIDTSALINAVIEGESATLRAIEAQQADIVQRRERIAALAGRITDISTAIDDVDDPDDWNLAAVTSEENTAFTADVDDDATTGTYTVRVDALAQAEVQATTGFADRATDNTIATGTLDVTVGGVTTTVTIDDTADTLGDLAAQLNEVDGITAYTINDGDATNPWRLVVQADETGLANAFTIDTSGLTGTGGGGVVPAFSTVSAAADADVTVNGVQVRSATNVLNDVVPGVDLSLRTEGGPAEILTVQQDTSGLLDRFQTVVDEINEAITYYDQQSFFNAETENRGPLAGDSTARRSIDRIGALISGSYTVADNDFEGLSQLGFSTNRDGTVTWDRDAFEEAYEADPDMVVGFLTSVDGPLAALKTEIDDVLVDSDEGTLTSRQESLKESELGFDERIADFQDYLDSYAERLRAQFTNLEVTLGRLQSSQTQLLSLFAGQTQQ